jgi:mitochondrial chaperone BCS1
MTLIDTLSQHSPLAWSVTALGAGAGFAILRKATQMALVHARRFLFISLEIPSKDKSYHWVLDWVSAREGDSMKHVSLETNVLQHESGQVAAKVNFIPGVGNHYFFFNGRPFQVQRSREKSLDISTGAMWESVTLTTFGKDRTIFYGLIQEAVTSALQREEGKTVIYTTSGTEWRRFGPARRRRPLHSVILDEGDCLFVCVCLFLFVCLFIDLLIY